MRVCEEGHTIVIARNGVAMTRQSFFLKIKVDCRAPIGARNDDCGVGASQIHYRLLCPLRGGFMLAMTNLENCQTLRLVIFKLNHGRYDESQ